MFLVLDGKLSSVNNTSYSDNAQGVYTWVNANPNYAIAKNYKCFVGGAMPGFHDYYKEGEGSNGYTTYDAEGGKLFQRQLDATKNAGLKYLQISTWIQVPRNVAEVYRREVYSFRPRSYLSMV